LFVPLFSDEEGVVVVDLDFGVPVGVMVFARVIPDHVLVGLLVGVVLPVGVGVAAFLLVVKVFTRSVI
jgi:hypothetical protein